MVTLKRNQIEILRKTLRHLEENSDLCDDDPLLAEIKASLATEIAEFDRLPERESVTGSLVERESARI